MSSTRTVNLNPGDELIGVAKVINQEAIDRFEYVGQDAAGQDGNGPPPVNIHTDDARAREMGLTRPVASGQMSFAFLHELLARRFGADFRQGGDLSVTFLKPVYGGDRVTARGVVEEVDTHDGRAVIQLRCWLENQDGVQTCAGRAEVIIPSPWTQARGEEARRVT